MWPFIQYFRTSDICSIPTVHDLVRSVLSSSCCRVGPGTLHYLAHVSWCGSVLTIFTIKMKYLRKVLAVFASKKYSPARNLMRLRIRFSCLYPQCPSLSPAWASSTLALSRTRLHPLTKHAFRTFIELRLNPAQQTPHFPLAFYVHVSRLLVLERQYFAPFCCATVISANG